MLFSAKRTAENYMSFEQVIDDTGAHVTKYSYWEAIIWDSNNLPNAPVYRQHIRSDEKDFIFLVQDDYQAKIISRYTFYGGKYSIGCKFGGVTIADGKINFFATDDTTKTVIANVDLPEELFLDQVYPLPTRTAFFLALSLLRRVLHSPLPHLISATQRKPAATQQAACKTPQLTVKTYTNTMFGNTNFVIYGSTAKSRKQAFMFWRIPTCPPYCTRYRSRCH